MPNTLYWMKLLKENYIFTEFSEELYFVAEGF